MHSHHLFTYSLHIFRTGQWNVPTKKCYLIVMHTASCCCANCIICYLFFIHPFIYSCPHSFTQPLDSKKHIFKICELVQKTISTLLNKVLLRDSSKGVPYFPDHKTYFFFFWKMWPKFDLRLMRRGYYFQTYKYLYPHQVKTTMKMILVAVMTIFWVSMMNKLYYGC
jgi:hypothetical protein